MRLEHHYSVDVRWTGNQGSGTSAYRDYSRSHLIKVAGKPEIAASSDPKFMGDPKRYNPEELFVASLSTCHMLWYLHLCSEAGVVVTHYSDRASGTMLEEKNGSGRFSSVVLRPMVVVARAGMIGTAQSLHERANAFCFIANSCNFPVTHLPECVAETNDDVTFEAPLD